MITKNNIKQYIQFLYKMKYYSDAPQELISKWDSLGNEEIQSNLSELYSSWGFDARKILETEIHFSNIKTQPEVEHIPYTNTEKINPVATTISTKRNFSGVKKLVLYLLISILSVGSIYLLYQYMQLQKMHAIYTLTQNVSIRDEQGKTIGSFALINNNKNDTYSELLAVDNEIYSLSIDSTDKKYNFRKVVFEEPSFIDFVKKEYTYGYVNANYVIEDKVQFEEYKRIFGKFQTVDNNRLKLSQRKIISTVLKNSSDHKGSYLLSSCKNANKKFSGFISNEIVENTRFQIIAKLEDGYYYSIVGDLNSNEYYEPTRIQLDGTDCNEDYLFKYISSDQGFKIYNCTGTQLDITCIYNENKMISSFETVYVPPVEDVEVDEDDGGDGGLFNLW